MRALEWWAHLRKRVAHWAGATAFGAQVLCFLSVALLFGVWDSIRSAVSRVVRSPTPAMPSTHNTVVEFRLFRYHSPDRWHLGQEFWRTFQDGWWKWDSAQRFAGKGLNCGHYFAATEAGSRAEATHYKMDVSGLLLVEVDVALDDLLDLRDESTLRDIVSECVENPEAAASMPIMQLLHRVVDVETGGTSLTDDIGAWAVDHGYRGILCFSARAVEPYRDVIDQRQDGQLGVYIADTFFEDLRNDPTLTNVVVFSGADLIRSVRQYRVHPGEMVPNAWYGAPEDSLDLALGEFGSDYQDERRARRPVLVQYTTLAWPW
jgi:hypothetical protein